MRENWLESYLRYTDDTEAPLLFRKWVGVSTVAACLQRKCWVEIEGIIYPNMYIILCGPSGSRKGTAMAPCRAMLKDLGIKMSAERLTKEALMIALKNAEYSIMDDRHGVILHSSLTVFSTELAVFLSKNDDGLMSVLTQWFDCENPWTYETKNAGTVEILGVFVNLIGATTPELLRSVLPDDAIGSGLTSRIIYVYAARKGKIVPWGVRTPESLEHYKQLVRDLEEILAMAGEFSISSGYRDAYIRWYVEQEKEPAIVDYHFEPYLTRRALHLRKLSMVHSAARANEMVLQAEDFENARIWLEEAEAVMPNVYRAFGRSDLASYSRG